MKAVFFDVDGTLIDCVEKKIPASSIKAIEELRKNGYKVALATGRDINSIRGIKDLDISVFDAYVLNNGAAIYDNTLRCIKDFPFLREDVEKILEYCNNKNMSLIFDTVEGPYLATEITDFLVEGKKYYKEEIPPYIEWKGEEIVKINIFAPMGYDFSELEKELQAEIDAIETTYPDYDEYRYNLASIGHDPFALISYLSAVHTEFTASEVQAEIEYLFDEMYELTLNPTEETRTRTVTKTGTHTVTDPVTGETTEEEYEYEVEEEYTVTILEVTLTAKDLNVVVAGKSYSLSPKRGKTTRGNIREVDNPIS